MSTIRTTTKKARKRTPPLSAYAAENKRRQAEFEAGFRERIEREIGLHGGPGKVQARTQIKGQTLQKIRKGGSRLALFAAFCETLGIDAHFLLTGKAFETPRRNGPIGRVVDDDVARLVTPDRVSQKKRQSKKTA